MNQEFRDLVDKLVKGTATFDDKVRLDGLMLESPSPLSEDDWDYFYDNYRPWDGKGSDK